MVSALHVPFVSSGASGITCFRRQRGSPAQANNDWIGAIRALTPRCAIASMQGWQLFRMRECFGNFDRMNQMILSASRLWA